MRGRGDAYDMFDTSNALQASWQSGDLINPGHMLLDDAWMNVDGLGQGTPEYQHQSKALDPPIDDSWATGWTGGCYWPDLIPQRLDQTSWEQDSLYPSLGLASDVEDFTDFSGDETNMPTAAQASNSALSHDLLEHWQTTFLNGCPYDCHTRLTQQLAQLDHYTRNGRAWRLDTLAVLEKDAQQQRQATLRCTICCSEQMRPATFTLMIRVLEGVFTLYERRFRTEMEATIDIKTMHNDNEAKLALCKQALRFMFEDHLHATLALEHELAGDGRECIEPCRNALARLRTRVKSAMRLELVPSTLRFA